MATLASIADERVADVRFEADRLIVDLMHYGDSAFNSKILGAFAPWRESNPLPLSANLP